MSELTPNSRKPYRRARGRGDGTVYKNSRGVWVAHLSWLSPDGERIRKERTFRLQKEAFVGLAELKRLRDSGRTPTRKSQTVGQLLDSWINFKTSNASVSVATSEQYRYTIRHLNAGLGSVRLDRLTAEIIDRFLTTKLDEGTSPRYVKLMRSVLSMALQQGFRWKIISSNPAVDTSPVKQRRTEGRALSEDEANKLLTAAQDDRLGALWTLMLSLGLRRGEALALRWSDFDRKARTLSITRNRKKEGSRVVTGELKTAGSRRVIPLPEFLVEALDVHRRAQTAEKEYLLSLGVSWAEHEAMFTTVQGYYLDPDHASKLFKNIAKKGGIGDWHLHELRHSAATFMLTKGVPLEVVADILGHSSIRITKDTYGHLTTERLKVGSAAMDELFGKRHSGD
ncbi:MAG: site-specific integrase [Thaumarchaeota archaeon]|nr:site-specific integrase [Nitrososphaerota archaeon]